MGTSISQRSPNTNNWRAVAAIYRSEEIPVERAVQEVWRAATNQPLGDLKSALAAPIIAQCLGITLEAKSPSEAYHTISKMVALKGLSTLATDLAKRAAVNSFSKPGNRRLNFAESLFSEAINYLVSRDLPGYVGVGDRISNVSDIIKFKKSVRQQVEITVNKYNVPVSVEKEYDSWKTYVGNVIDILVGKHK